MLPEHSQRLYWSQGDQPMESRAVHEPRVIELQPWAMPGIVDI
jgi:hypothetical protein